MSSTFKLIFLNNLKFKNGLKNLIFILKLNIKFI